MVAIRQAPAGFVDMTAYILEREPKPGYEHTARLVDQNYKPVYIAAEEAKTLDDWIRALSTVRPPRVSTKVLKNLL